MLIEIKYVIHHWNEQFLLLCLQTFGGHCIDFIDYAPCVSDGKENGGSQSTSSLTSEQAGNQSAPNAAYSNGLSEPSDDEMNFSDNDGKDLMPEDLSTSVKEKSEDDNDDSSISHCNIAQQRSPRSHGLHSNMRSHILSSPSSSPKKRANNTNTTTNNNAADTNNGASDVPPSKRPCLSSPQGPQLSYGNLPLPPHLQAIYEAGVLSHGSEVSEGADLRDLHPCQVCSKVFPKPSDLKRHMMCHTGEKPFRCQVRQ